MGHVNDARRGSGSRGNPVREVDPGVISSIKDAELGIGHNNHVRDVELELITSRMRS